VIASSAPTWLLIVSPLLVLVGTIVGAAIAIIGQLFSERYKRYHDCQMTARGIAASIDATLIMAERRGYVQSFENMIARISQGEQIKAEMIIEDASIDPITAKMLDRVGLLGHNLPARVVTFMQVLTGIRQDLVRFGRGELSDNMPDLAFILAADLALWREFEPRARVLVRDLRNYASERFRFWSWQ